MSALTIYPLRQDGSGVYCHADGRLHFGFYAQDRMLLDEALPKESDAGDRVLTIRIPRAVFEVSSPHATVAPQIKIHIGDLLESVCPGDAEYAISATKVSIESPLDAQLLTLRPADN